MIRGVDRRRLRTLSLVWIHGGHHRRLYVLRAGGPVRWGPRLVAVQGVVVALLGGWLPRVSIGVGLVRDEGGGGRVVAGGWV